MAYKVECKLVAFLGDVEHFPCHFGYEVGDSFIYDGEKFIGRICPAVLTPNMLQAINNIRYWGNSLPNNYPWTYSGISKRDLNMKKYDGVGWTNVKNAPRGAKKELVDMSGLKMPFERVKGRATFTCSDPRTLAMFRCEPYGLANKGFDLPFYRRQMSILKKIKIHPGLSVSEVLEKFTKWERENIYPRLGNAIVEIMMEELAGAGYIEFREGKAYLKGQNN